MNRIYKFLDERLNLSPLVKDIADHPVPDHANPLKTPSAFMYCFGGIAFFIILLQVLTGVFLMLYYVPSPDHAYASVSYIQNETAFGSLVQGAHRVGASVAVLMVLLHMLRVVFTGSYKNPRELNWVVGVFLLLVVVGFSFTGYLLPWDQKAYWATTVGVNMVATVPLVGEFLADVLRGGDEVGALTLVRFFVIHVMFLPALLVVFLAAHFFMIRRQGLSRPL
ncbi:MAG: cytochrome b N-terminal domain-containing protein [Deltaproteobacteria bacterium]|nr:cytochrome b N-terminal domain-containing protein [Deltaproteobacteria bacterium]